MAESGGKVIEPEIKEEKKEKVNNKKKKVVFEKGK